MREHPPWWMRWQRPSPPPLHAREHEEDRGLKIRARLLRADPHCFWCGIEVVPDQPKQPDFATVDHLYSRWHPERLARHADGRSVLHVLACAACNQERAGCESQGVPFTPKLPERWEFAKLADAALASNGRPVLHSGPPLKAAVRQRLALKPKPPSPPMRVIQTLEEAIEYARENPGR